MLKDSLTPLAIIKDLVDCPHLADKILFDIEEKYDKKYGKEEIMIWSKPMNLSE